MAVKLQSINNNVALFSSDLVSQTISVPIFDQTQNLSTPALVIAAATALETKYVAILNLASGINALGH